MGVFEWTAIIGAAAWLPQVFGWVVRHYTKPKIRVILSRAPEIGYTSFGPIFNLRCAFAADRKDGIIERITCRVTHERGQVVHFRWFSLNETFSQVRSPQGVAEVSRSQPAIALKVSTLVLAEKQVAMQEENFEEDFRVPFNALTDRHIHFRQTESEQFAELTLKSKEFADLIAFTKKRFPWQEGKYTLQVALQIVGVREATMQTFHFALNASDVDRLRQNITAVDLYIRSLIQPPAVDSLPSYQWNWAYPSFDPPTL